MESGKLVINCMNVCIVKINIKEWYGNAVKFYHLVFVTHVYKFASKHISFCLLERESYDCRQHVVVRWN